MTDPTEASPIIAQRYYPAELLLPDADGPVPALVLVSAARVYAWTAPGVLALDQPYDPHTSTVLAEWQMRQNPTVLATPAGQVFVNRGRGCGCGDPLKAYQPFTPARAGS